MSETSFPAVRFVTFDADQNGMITGSHTGPESMVEIADGVLVPDSLTGDEFMHLMATHRIDEDGDLVEMLPLPHAWDQATLTMSGLPEGTVAVFVPEDPPEDFDPYILIEDGHVVFDIDTADDYPIQFRAPGYLVLDFVVTIP